MIRFALSLILALTLAVTASAGHGGFFASRNNLQAARLNAKAAQLNFKAQQFNAGHHHSQNFRQRQPVIYVPAQNFRLQQNAGHCNDGSLGFRQNFNNGCHNDGVLQFNGGCQSLYR